MQEETRPVAVARYDGVAEWFDRELATSELGVGVTAHGLRAKVGATHLTLGHLLAAFLDAELELETLDEPETRAYPIMIALRCRR